MRIIYGYRREGGSAYHRPVCLEGPWWRVFTYRAARWLFWRALAAERREAVRQRPVDLFALAGMEEAAG